MASIHKFQVNATDLEDRLLYKQGSWEPNMTFAWTGNIGVVSKDPIASHVHVELWRQELELAIQAVFGNHVKVVLDGEVTLPTRDEAEEGRKRGFAWWQMYPF